MLRLRQHVFAIALVDAPVFITGESGSGKEMIARLIHQRSVSHDGPFLKVNCAALPDELLESEMFGYEAGAFTGAVHAKPGQFELAGKGTIFLDEVAEMSPRLQAKLLHVLQDRQVARLGRQETTAVSARVIAATNVDVEEAIRSGALRRDLYYRLNVFPIHMPPLCERAAEIPVLLWHFLRQYSAKLKRQTVTVSIDLLRASVRYKWPGNVRELENFAKRHVILGDEEASIRQLTESPVGQRHIVPAAPAVSACEQGLKAFNRGLRDRVEKELITAALARTQWNRKEAARILGISYSALRSRILRMGLSRRRRLGNRPNNFQRTAGTNSGLPSGVQLASTL